MDGMKAWPGLRRILEGSCYQVLHRVTPFIPALGDWILEHEKTALVMVMNMCGSSTVSDVAEERGGKDEATET